MTPESLLTLGLTNALLATLLAALGWLLTRVWANPHVASAVWLVVLLKLVTPPLVSLPIALPPPEATTSATLLPVVRSSIPIPLPGEGGAGSEGPPSTTVAPPSNEPGASATGAEPLPRAVVAGPPNPTESLPASPNDSPIPFQSSTTRFAPLRSITTGTVLLAIWLTGSVALAAVTVFRVLRFRSALNALSTPDASTQAVAHTVAARLGLRRCPAVRSVPTNVGPLVWAGAPSPIVIVPRPLWNRLGEPEREALLAHELAHVARGDHWVRRAEAILLPLYWWLPTAWFAVRRREAAAESCCDALVLATCPDGPRAYAEALFVAVNVLSTGRAPALASGLGAAAELKERLAMIVHDRVPRRPSRPVRLGLFSAGVAALFLSAELVRADPTAPPSTDAPAEGEARGTSVSVAPAPSATPPAAARPIPADPTAVPVVQTPAYGAGLLPSEGDSSPADAAAAPVSGMGGRTRSSSLRRGPASPMGKASPGSGSMSSRPPAGGMAPPYGMSGMMGMESMMGTGMGPALSAEVREKMIVSLLAIIGNPKEPETVKAQALRSLGRIGGNDDALFARLASTNAYDALWALLENAKDWETRESVVAGLSGLNATPQTPLAIRTLALYVAQDRAEADSIATNGFGAPQPTPRFAGAFTMLDRLASSGEGLRRIVETIRTADYETAELGEGSIETVEQRKTRMESIYGTVTPVRTTLLSLIADAQPTSDEIALALVEALSSEDEDIRRSAAQALGNAGADGSGAMSMYPGS